MADLSISVTIKTPAAIVLATDSRLTMTLTHGDGRREDCQNDWAQKVWVPGPPTPSLAVSFFGDANIAGGLRQLGELVTEWSRGQGTRKTVEEAARELHTFLKPKMRQVSLMVAGYDATAYHGRVFELLIPGDVVERHPGGTSGVSPGGQKAVASAILGQLRVPFDGMSARGSVELARYLINAAITAQQFNLGFAGVGGAVQVAVLERGQAARLEQF